MIIRQIKRLGSGKNCKGYKQIKLRYRSPIEPVDDAKTTQENSAKLTNQRVSYAFTSSPFSIYVRHILPTSKFQHSYSCILLIFYRHQWTACVRTESVNTVHWFDASCSGTPVNNSITFISPVQSLSYIFCRWQYMRSSANFQTVLSETQKCQLVSCRARNRF